MSKHLSRADAELWAAVDQLTQPSTRRLHRADHGDAVNETVADLRRQDQADRLVPADLGRYAAMTRRYATVPSLWDQGLEALGASNADQAEGGGGSVHRTPCDVDLMEQLAVIRNTTTSELAKRRLDRTGTVPAQIRRLTAHIAGHEPHHVDHWTSTFVQWARLLEHYLRIVQGQPKPRRIRGVACPECQLRSVLIEYTAGQPVRVPAIVIDFYDGQIRAAECSGCGALLAWRGEQLWQLADRIQTATQ